MFVPLYDANRLKHIRLQYVTVGLIVLNVSIWLLFSTTGETGAYISGFTLSYGFTPAVVNDYRELEPALAVLPEGLTYVTYAFLHMDIWHLGGNMLFLWVFGDNVEDAFGHLRFALFYLACAAAGALAHAMVGPQSEHTLIGASGAVSGIVAAYLMLHPRVWIWVLAFGRIPVNLPAYVVLVLWIGYQVFMLAGMMELEVSYGAHVGGILTGAALTLVLRRRGVALFDRPLPDVAPERSGEPS